MDKSELTPMVALSEVIKVRRVRAGMSQADLAKAMDCTRTYVSKVENGRAEPRLETLERFARALKTTPWRLLKDTYRLIYPEVFGEVFVSAHPVDCAPKRVQPMP